MKRFLGLAAVLMGLGSTGVAQAQVIVVPAYGPVYSSGIGFEYRSKHLKVAGFLSKGFYGAGYTITPYGTIYGGPYGYPVGVVEKNVTINIYNPPAIAPAPYEPFAPDPDAVKPDKYPTPTSKFNGPAGPEPKVVFPPAAEPIPDMPGKDVSVPKKALRPEDMVEPVKPKVEGTPLKPVEFPAPPAPLPVAHEEANRLIGLGLEEFKDRDFGLAGQHFNKAAEVDPTNFLAHVLSAQADFAFARYGDAVKSIRIAAKLQKDYPSVKFQPRLSLYKGLEGDYFDQMALLKAAVKNNPKSGDLLFLLGHQLWFDDQRDAAVEQFLLARPLTADPALIDQFLNAAKAKVIASK